MFQAVANLKTKEDITGFFDAIEVGRGGLLVVGGAWVGLIGVGGALLQLIGVGGEWVGLIDVGGAWVFD